MVSKISMKRKREMVAQRQMGQRVELLARKLCQNAGHDPDLMASHGPAVRIMTPNGEVCALPSDAYSYPLWMFWRYTASSAIEAVEGAEKPSTGQIAAKAASKAMKDPKASIDAKSVAASVLTQRKDSP